LKKNIWNKSFYINLTNNNKLLLDNNIYFITISELMEFYQNLEANYKLIDGKLYENEEAELIQMFIDL
jgi:hypothetical protein